jgi:hypothetical protein
MRTYEGEIEMLRKALKRVKSYRSLPFIADKGYDAVDITESLLDRGDEYKTSFEEAI